MNAELNPTHEITDAELTDVRGGSALDEILKGQGLNLYILDDGYRAMMAEIRRRNAENKKLPDSRFPPVIGFTK
ncbi:MAG: hypothetical protein RL033_3973 [Pseudomonadota bacterium]|jgi:hypothetical protein